MFGPLLASNRRSCKASTGIDTVLGKWSTASLRHSGVASGQKSGGWCIEVLRCIHSLLEIVLCKWASVRVGGPVLNVAAVGKRMQTDRESKRVRLDGWSLHGDPTANAESSGDENGAHDGKPGKDEGVYWKKERKDQFVSASLPLQGFDIITWMPLRSSR